MVKAGQCNARRLNRAHTLLMSNKGMTDATIANALHISTRSVERRREKYAQKGLGAALNERPRPGAKKKLDANQEAHLVAIACSKPPTGHKRWTLDLLAQALVEREVVDKIAKETVRSILKKTK